MRKTMICLGPVGMSVGAIESHNLTLCLNGLQCAQNDDVPWPCRDECGCNRESKFDLMKMHRCNLPLMPRHFHLTCALTPPGNLHYLSLPSTPRHFHPYFALDLPGNSCIY